MSLSHADLLKFANLQLAAEAFLANSSSELSALDRDDFVAFLESGNGFSSKFTPVAARSFADEWTVLAQKSNTETGFSGTVFQHLRNREIVISFRSTEFVNDSVRDNMATNAFEIAETGLAWGQIADMEDWFESVVEPLIGKEQRVSVTGYSLGGHLATVFNLLHHSKIDKTVTFNGAGVGYAQTSSSLKEMIEGFDALRESRTEITKEIAKSDPVLAAFYEQLRIESFATLDEVKAARAALDQLYFLPLRGLAEVLDGALENVEELIDEGGRISTLTSGVSGGVQNPLAVNFHSIAAQMIDYQMAVALSASQTSAVSMVIGAGLTFIGPAIVRGVLANQYDVKGDTLPSAVANSQLHYGQDVNVFIEDQPLYRGGVLSESAKASLAYWDGVKLLVDKYKLRDFGDTHSLVLLIDSLTVQNALSTFFPIADRDGAETLQVYSDIFAASSNLRKRDGSLFFGNDQGKAIGDVLENTLNSMSRMLGLQGNLNGSPEGNTWAEMEAVGGYSGRADLANAADTIVKLAVSSGMAGGGGITASSGAGSEARVHFGQLLSVVYLSPYALDGATILSKLQTVQSELYAQWRQDYDLLGATDPEGRFNFTDAYLARRAGFNERLTYFNVRDARYSTATGDVEIGDAEAAAYDNDHQVYLDLTRGITIQRGAISDQTYYITFGTEGADATFASTGNGDYLFGGGGADVIKGGGGGDHLEGNSGNDVVDGESGNDTLLGGTGNDVLSGGTGSDRVFGGVGLDVIDGGDENDYLNGDEGSDVYLFSAAYGHDTIFDIDGVNELSINGSSISQGQFLSPGKWESVDGVGNKLLFALVTSREGATNLVIAEASGKNSVTVLNWTPGVLGITLAAETPGTTPANTLIGDFAKKPAPGGGYEPSETGYVPDGAQPGAQDYIYGLSGGDFISGLGGNDGLSGQSGNDSILGGEGNDVLLGGLGRDTLRGGSGDDWIAGSARGEMPGAAWSGAELDYAGGIELNRGFGWVTYAATERDARGHPLYILVGMDAVSRFNDDTNVIDGDGGNDYITTGTGNDVAHGGAGNDSVAGGAGSDILYGDEGDDQLSGDASHEQSDGGNVVYSFWAPVHTHGADVIDGGSGNDTIRGGGQGDHLYGGAGNDMLDGDSYKTDEVPLSGHGSDYLDGGDDDDQLIGHGNDDQLFGGNGADKLWGDGDPEQLAAANHGSDFLDGGAGGDYLEGGGASDRLLGGLGDDIMWGDASMAASRRAHGNDVLDGGEGNDALYGGGGDDSLNGGTGNDTMTGDADEVHTAMADHGADMLNGEDGNDEIFGDGGNDTLFGGAGNDKVHGDSSAIPVQYHGNDILSGGAGMDTMFGGGGADALFGGEGDDYLAGDDDSVASASQGADSLEGGSGQDTLLGYGGDDVMHGGSENDVLRGDQGNDFLYGDTGNDYLMGGAGDDHLFGGDGADVLDGGGGNDTVDGGAGNDRYIIGPTLSPSPAPTVLHSGDFSLQTVRSTSSNTTTSRLLISDTQGANIFQFNGASNSTISVVPNASASNDLVLSNGASTFVISNGLVRDVLATVSVANGEVLNRTSVMARASAVNILGTAEVDDVLGSNFNDVIAGGDGDDLLVGALGDDMLAGGNGNDLLAGQAGNDTLNGGDGSDIYLFKRGSGNDLIIGSALDNRGATDSIMLQDNILPGEVVLSRQGANLQLSFGTDRITVQDYFLGSNDNMIDRVEFADGTIWGREAIDIGVSEGSAQHDQLYGTDAADKLYGLGGNDTIRGFGGHDELFGDEGLDQLEGGTGDDILNGGDGDDLLDGGAGNDTLDGGALDDIVLGGEGDDIYRFRAGSGADRIGESYGVDSLQLGGGILPANIQLDRYGTDPRLTVLDAAGVATNDSVVLYGMFGSDDGRGRIEQVVFDNGTVWTAEMVRQMLDVGIITEKADVILGYGWSDTIDGLGGDDKLYGQEGNDTLSGSAGNDTLYGGEGSDSLHGGAGRDDLEGGEGNDSYRYRRGDGADRILEKATGSSTEDTIRLGSGIVEDDVTLHRDGDSLILMLNTSTDQLVVENFFGASPPGRTVDYRIEQIAFDSGAVWNASTIETKVIASAINNFVGTANNDNYVVDNAGDTISESVGQGIDSVASSVSRLLEPNVENLTLTGFLSIGARGNELNNLITGNAGHNSLVGEAGNDALNGGDGDDTLDGGTGNDTLSGGLGDDTYRLMGTGSDRGSDVLIESAGQGIDTVVTDYQFTLPTNFENLTQVGSVDTYALPWLTGNALNNIIIGNFRGSIIDGLAGADTMMGGGGPDLYYVDNPGDVVIDTYIAGTLSDPGDDQIHTSVSYTLPVGVERLILTGRAETTAMGNDANNHLSGAYQADVLGLTGGTTGNFANNRLIGGKGNDTYGLDRGDIAVELPGEGNDTVYIAYSSASELALLALANYENIENINAQASGGTWRIVGDATDNVLTGGMDGDKLEGGAGNDILSGLRGHDTLDGGFGADSMNGGEGFDTYIVDHVGDVISETSGRDTVASSIDYTLGASLENITLTGSEAINARGNLNDNRLTGNVAANLLFGGGGNDVYIFDMRSGHDVVDNFSDDFELAVDTVALDSWVEPDAVSIDRDGQDLRMNFGEADSVRVLNYFVAGGAWKVDQLRFRDGTVWSQAEIEARILIPITGTVGHDQLLGTDTADLLVGLSGNDTLSGLGGNDRLIGESGDDRLDGGAGADMMSGGAGDDTYIVDSNGDRVTESGEAGLDHVLSDVSYSLSAHVENLTLTGTAESGTGNDLNNRLLGNGSENSLQGGAGNDTLNGGGGVDYLSGGDGSDTYEFGPSSGQVYVSDKSTAPGEIDYIRVSGTLPDAVTVHRDDSRLWLAINGNSSRLGLDWFVNDPTYREKVVTFNNGVVWDAAALEAKITVAPVSPGNDFLYGTAGADTFDGGDGDDNFWGLYGNDSLTGGAGDDSFEGGPGDDLLTGGGGIDYFSFDAGDGRDVIRETGTEDSVIVLGLDTSITTAYRVGNDLKLVFNPSDQLLITGYYIGKGPTAWEFVAQPQVGFDGWTASDIAAMVALNPAGGTAGADDIKGRPGDDLLYGLGGNDTITGYAGNDLLDGGTGNDRLIGGSGNDVYIVDSSTDIVVELASEGTDTVNASSSFVLSSNIEVLTLTGNAAINGTGNSLGNTLNGNSAVNTLDGGVGADTMIGGSGNDSYIVDNGLDVIQELASGRNDDVKASVTYTLSAELENLTLTGAAAINGTGNVGNNVLVGNTAVNLLSGGLGNDTLNGGVGADRLVGGNGDDTYIVDNSAEVITENSTEGMDSAQSSVNFTLPINVETLTLTGTAAINGTGNGDANTIIGNVAANTLMGGGGNDRLDGGVGADAMHGGTGNDTYIVDNAADKIMENAGEGIDVVQTSLGWTLGANADALMLTGTTSVNGKGNVLDNLLIGNASTNTLSGEAGKDILQGGAGADTLNDTLGNNLFDGGGGNDVIMGGAGAEFFVGGTGNDNITTAGGPDVVAFNRGDGQDLIGASTGKDNTISLGKGVTYADLLFKKAANDLILVTGSNEQLTIKDWYLSANNRNVSNLQMVIEGSTDYDALSGSALKNKKIVTFNFEGLSVAFDQARVANPSLTSWALSASLLTYHLRGSDTAAIGGDLAYHYAMSGNLGSLSMTPALALMGSTQFGTTAQVLQNAGALRDGTPSLV